MAARLDAPGEGLDVCLVAREAPIMSRPRRNIVRWRPVIVNAKVFMDELTVIVLTSTARRSAPVT
jgi:hypothetical protein